MWPVALSSAGPARSAPRWQIQRHSSWDAEWRCALATTGLFQPRACRLCADTLEPCALLLMLGAGLCASQSTGVWPRVLRATAESCAVRNSYFPSQLHTLCCWSVGSTQLADDLAGLATIVVSSSIVPSRLRMRQHHWHIRVRRNGQELSDGC